jgi:malate/lactate dehydrogenase
MDIKEVTANAKNDLVLMALRDENESLKRQVAQLQSMITIQSNSITPEELICIEQIGILKQSSSKRELSLDEVKRLDLLNKNLRLIKDQSTQAVDHKDYRNVKEADLVAIAAGRTEEDDQ